MSKKKWNEAKSKFLKCIELGTFVGDASMYLGLVYANQNENSKALSFFNKAVNLKPQDTFVLRNRARFFENNLMHQKAYQDIYNALNLQPEIYENWDLYLQHLYWVKKDIVKTKEVFGEVKKNFPKDERINQWENLLSGQ